MKIRLYADETASVDTADIVAGLSARSPSITWALGSARFHTRETYISNPKTYQSFSKALKKETQNDDFAFLFTEKPYDNNYFWDAPWHKEIVLSLFGWEHLTSLPRNNGVAYFCVALLVRALGIGQSHRGPNTGCINDFWQDKTGVDAAMRAAFICRTCLTNSTTRKKVGRNDKLLAELTSVLDDISHASRANEDICEFWRRTQRTANSAAFDVFMCHNSKDKGAVKQLNTKLKRNGISTWLDEEQLPPGRAWQDLLEEQIDSIASVAVFVGSSGTGPWQDMEIKAFLSEFVRRKCPVIPVILSNCTAIPQLPLFMRQFTWVDFRKADPPPISQLLWGITGKKPVAK